VSYSRALKALEDNARQQLTSTEDRYRWNLNMALMALVEAVEADMRRLNDRMAEIERRLGDRGT
jgi:hypothetical protein